MLRFLVSPRGLVPVLRGTRQFWFQTLGTVAKRPVVHAVAIAGSATGTGFPGVTCNRRHLDPASLVLLRPLVADDQGYVQAHVARSPTTCVSPASSCGSKEPSTTCGPAA